MILLDFNIIAPAIGTIFWTSLIFILAYFLVGKLGFKPIAEGLRKRESDIDNSLRAAEQAREEMSQLVAKNEELLAEAREERSAMLKEAKEVKEKMIEDAKLQAREEAGRILESAKEEINNQKMAAVTEVKNSAGQMAVTIAEQIMRKDLSAGDGQQAFVSKLIDDFKLN